MGSMLNRKLSHDGAQNVGVGDVDLVVAGLVLNLFLEALLLVCADRVLVFVSVLSAIKWKSAFKVYYQWEIVYYCIMKNRKIDLRISYETSTTLGYEKAWKMNYVPANSCRREGFLAGRVVEAVWDPTRAAAEADFVRWWLNSSESSSYQYENKKKAHENWRNLSVGKLKVSTKLKVKSWMLVCLTKSLSSLYKNWNLNQACNYRASFADSVSWGQKWSVNLFQRFAALFLPVGGLLLWLLLLLQWSTSHPIAGKADER